MVLYERGEGVSSNSGSKSWLKSVELTGYFLYNTTNIIIIAELYNLEVYYAMGSKAFLTETGP